MQPPPFFSFSMPNPFRQPRRIRLTFILKEMELHAQQANRLAKCVGRGAFLLGAKLEDLLEEQTHHWVACWWTGKQEQYKLLKAQKKKIFTSCVNCTWDENLVTDRLLAQKTAWHAVLAALWNSVCVAMGLLRFCSPGILGMIFGCSYFWLFRGNSFH